MSLLDAVQWPAMAITVAASWFVASTQKQRRNIGFWLFLVSNVAWVIWGVHSGAHALIALQICLAAMNIRGAVKLSAESKKSEPAQGGNARDRLRVVRSDERPAERV